MQLRTRQNRHFLNKHDKKALYIKSLYCCEKAALFTIGLEMKRKLHPVTIDTFISSQYIVGIEATEIMCAFWWWGEWWALLAPMECRILSLLFNYCLFHDTVGSLTYISSNGGISKHVIRKDVKGRWHGITRIIIFRYAWTVCVRKPTKNRFRPIFAAGTFQITSRSATHSTKKIGF